MFKILAYSYCVPSAMILRDALEELTGKKIIVIKDYKNWTPNIVINYGFSEVPPTATCNTGQFIRLSTHKKDFSVLMQEHQIPTPVFYRSSNLKPTEFPFLIRETLTGTGGKGIIPIRNSEEHAEAVRTIIGNTGSNNYYWTPFINMRTEFRIHILGGRAVKVFKKVRQASLEEEACPIRNIHNGYHFSLVQNIAGMEKLLQLVSEVDTVLAPIGADFYALDVGWEQERKRWIVIEANSAPGLNESTAFDYANFFVKKLNLTKANSEDNNE